jgi:hypothetical protein
MTDALNLSYPGKNFIELFLRHSDLVIRFLPGRLHLFEFVLRKYLDPRYLKLLVDSESEGIVIAYVKQGRGQICRFAENPLHTLEIVTPCLRARVFG